MRCAASATSVGTPAMTSMTGTPDRMPAKSPAVIPRSQTSSIVIPRLPCPAIGPVINPVHRSTSMTACRSTRTHITTMVDLTANSPGSPPVSREPSKIDQEAATSGQAFHSIRPKTGRVNSACPQRSRRRVGARREPAPQDVDPHVPARAQRQRDRQDHEGGEAVGDRVLQLEEPDPHDVAHQHDDELGREHHPEQGDREREGEAVKEVGDVFHRSAAVGARAPACAPFLCGHPGVCPNPGRCSTGIFVHPRWTRSGKRVAAPATGAGRGIHPLAHAPRAMSGRLFPLWGQCGNYTLIISEYRLIPGPTGK